MYGVQSSIVEAVTRDGERLSLMNTSGVTGPRFLRPAGPREADGECLHVPLSQEIGRHIPRCRVLGNNMCQRRWTLNKRVMPSYMPNPPCQLEW